MRKGIVLYQLLIIAAVILVVGLTPLMIGAAKCPGETAPIMGALNGDNNGDKTPAKFSRTGTKDKDDKTPAHTFGTKDNGDKTPASGIRIRSSKDAKDDKTPAEVQ